ncbi:succinate dehydrogenase iron-sulfur subunit [Planococcus sp. ISL-109]|uniref:succinate dehydrogenase iron-sulfur subunit n=1 Tax=Planococcus sp. ISL-109 TaxID=2819166 RepID=UPI001BE8E8F6|nr:succinate dehydrogenase iron-sulfur subunit [Planococcus sp. ISL-109]
MGKVEKTVVFEIERRNTPDGDSYWEKFELPHVMNMNVISGLMEIRRHPVNMEGEKTTPVAWDMNCLEEVCGACSMVINGYARQSCTALVDQLEHPIRLQPMKTFPVVRDLIIDRSSMFDTLKRLKVWIPIDGTHDLGEGPRMPERKRQWAYELSKCMTCGVCLEACPNVNEKSDYIGAAPISQVRLMNAHPTGAMNKDERLNLLMGPGGIQECGMAQNCVETCPKGIPLTTSISSMNRDTTVQMFRNFFGSDSMVE